MHDDSQFLRHILARPDDDAPRLVYADVLEERGETARSEFIRVQCQLAKTETWTGTHTVCHHDAQCEVCCSCLGCLLHRREHDLLHPDFTRVFPGFMWAPEVVKAVNGYPASVGSYEWRRGFVERVTLPWDRWSTHAAALLGAQPIRRVRLTSEPRVTLTGNEHGNTVYHLDGCEVHVGPTGEFREHRQAIAHLLADHALSLGAAPGIEFELPASESAQQIVSREAARLMSEEINVLFGDPTAPLPRGIVR